MQQCSCYRKFLTGWVVLLFLVALRLPAYAANGKECTDLTQEQIGATLKKMNVPAAEIVGIKKSPLAGICEIEVNSRGQAGIFYTDAALNYLIFGSLHDTKNMVNLTAASVQKLQDKKRIDLAKIPLQESLAVGGKGGAKKVVVFSDPD